MRASRFAVAAFVVLGSITTLSSIASAQCWHSGRHQRWPNWTLSLGGTWHQLAASDLGSDEPMPPGVLGAAGPVDTVPRYAVTSFDSVFLFHFGRFHTGTETAIGFGDLADQNSAGGRSSIILGQSSLLFGISAPLGPVSLFADVYGGLRILGVTDSTRGSQSLVAGPRVGAALFLGRHFALSATFGEDLLHHGEQSFGLSLVGVMGSSYR